MLGLMALSAACSEESPTIPPFVEVPDKGNASESGFFEDFTDAAIDDKKWALCPEGKNANWKKFMGKIALNRYLPVDGNLSLRAVDPAGFGQEATNAPLCMGLQTMTSGGRVFYGFRYGEVSVRAKFPRMGAGAWPAIWLMPVDENSLMWPKAGEIDIMEHYGAEQHIEQTLHYVKSSDGTTAANKTTRVRPGTAGLNLDDYNIYGCIKSPDKIEWIVNGEVTFTVTRAQVEADGGIWPYEERDYYIIINQACAPMQSYGGDAWRAGWLPSLADLPYEMTVDWVRVEEQQDEIPEEGAN